MKLFFDYETKSTLDSLLDTLLPPISLAELQIFDSSTQHHIKQMERARTPQVDRDSCGKAIPMLAILDAPGRYVATGTEVLLLDAPADGILGS